MNKTEIDLGQLEETLLVFGGPYSNFQATQAIKSKAQELSIPPERIICTGDIVAYCAQPNETVRLIRDWDIHVVQGNCEYSLGNDEPDCGCGFEEDSACDLASKEWFDYSRTRVSQNDKDWMKHLPYALRFEMCDQRFCCIHGSYSEQNEFVFESTPEEHKLAELDLAGTDVIIGGHCGLPFGQNLSGGKAWLNAGVIGMPANDAKPHTWFMLVEPSGKDLKISWEALAYDSAGCKESMQSANVSKGYQSSIASGLWPNMDILPAEEQQRKGIEIKPFSMKLLSVRESLNADIAKCVE